MNIVDPLNRADHDNIAHDLEREYSKSKLELDTLIETGQTSRASYFTHRMFVRVFEFYAQEHGYKFVRNSKEVTVGHHGEPVWVVVHGYNWWHLEWIGL